VASEMLLDQLLKMLNEKYINMYLLKIERYSRTLIKQYRLTHYSTHSFRDSEAFFTFSN
jgi:hypothetical protein